MTGPPPYDQYPSHGDRREPAPARIAAGRLWATGAATAAVAALAAVVTTLLIRGVLGVPVFAPDGAGAWGDATTGYLAALAAGAALVATALLHLLLVATPRPGRFFTWIVLLVTAAMMLFPFTTGIATESKFGTAAVALVTGLAIASLLSSAVPSVVTDRDRFSG
ncbi:DUF6069 family protein [Streptomyces atacamensis]|jgi:hypothetical protein|uniref:DUF6069 family protein n=1 Tax=Streptomyces atacamensis TaxID=531966 RepID=UPI00399C58DA